jgi:hypothetical protein
MHDIPVDRVIALRLNRFSDGHAILISPPETQEE